MPTPFDEVVRPAAAKPVPLDELPKTLTLSRKAWVYADTCLRTTYDSFVKPVASGAAIAAASFLLLTLVFDGTELFAAARSLSLRPLASAMSGQLAALSAAVGALAVAIWSAKDYSFDGRGFLVRSLAKHVTLASAKFGHTPLAYLQFYHRTLRVAGAVAFLCEIVFQVLAFTIVTWGIANAMPGLGLFTNPQAVTIPNTLLFWGHHVFTFVDGPNIFGTAPPIHANASVWPFGVAIIFFKLVIIGQSINLFRGSLALTPADISESWGKLLAGKG